MSYVKFADESRRDGSRVERMFEMSHKQGISVSCYVDVTHKLGTRKWKLHESCRSARLQGIVGLHPVVKIAAAARMAWKRFCLVVCGFRAGKGST